ncbi:glycosyltransferase [Halorubrum ezzemoulense]|uniref:glycosyltransferase n=1 Tax=Halorubrum ezzemoulense TaxID=337243 RepID=UPI0023312B47|nr:glycosyltransferase [Halorubrum ezzemoulense]MDB9281722.1 glycosyltransferase [Halorubrum ezzemoulense]MDB9285244.1 glycosyltransferase [Halorubrum ezzemoulense]
MSNINKDSIRKLSDKSVLYLCHDYRYFTKGQIDHLAPYFRDVHVLVRYNPVANISNYLPIDRLKKHRKKEKLDFDGTPKNVTVTTLPMFWLPVDKHRRRLGAKHAKKAKSAVRSLDIEPDLIHSQFTWTAGFAGQQVAEENNIPFILTVHQNQQSLDEKISSGNEDVYNTWRSANKILRVNRQDLSKLRIYNDNVVRVPNGFDSRMFEHIGQKSARDNLGLSNDATIVFSLGHLKQRKGFQHMIQAWPLVEDQLPDPRYVIGGRGPMKGELQSLIETQRLSEQIELLGHVPPTKLNDWMNAADVFVLPSYSESFGVVQLEAMACGTPVVATRNGGSEEVVSSDSLGILVDSPEDHGRLSEAILEAINKDWDRQTILEYANDHSWENVANIIARNYIEVLD